MQEFDATRPDVVLTPTPRWIQALHADLVGRLPEPKALAYWLTSARRGAVHHRASTLWVIRGVLASTEYCAQRATELHERMLGREPGDNELADRVLEVMHGTPLQQVVVGFATSAEYIARAETRPVAHP